ncbi:MAG: hypothetical protein J2P54_06665, partial [Bradyrhizobiaceae bacterium]|nr:hypothetical protein [Bradyrhizobiaceae bacterium]
TTLVHVPYCGGQIDLPFPLVADVFSFVQSGQLHAFALISDKHVKALPDPPTTTELGYPLAFA